MKQASNGNGLDQCGSHEKWVVYGHIVHIKPQVTLGGCEGSQIQHHVKVFHLEWEAQGFPSPEITKIKLEEIFVGKIRSLIWGII